MTEEITYIPVERPTAEYRTTDKLDIYGIGSAEPTRRVDRTRRVYINLQNSSHKYPYESEPVTDMHGYNRPVIFHLPTTWEEVGKAAADWTKAQELKEKTE